MGKQHGQIISIEHYGTDAQPKKQVLQVTKNIR